MNINNISMWDDIISVKDILKFYKEDKQQIINLITTDINQLIKKMTTKSSCHENDFACMHCRNMKFLNINNTDPVLLQKDYVLLVKTPITKLFLKFNNSILQGDSFLIKTLVTWCIEHVFRQHKLPHFLTLLITFSCKNTGYQLYKIPVLLQEENNTLSSFDTFVTSIDVTQLTDVSYGLLCQIVVIFNELKMLKFTHPTIALRSILIEEKKCAYIYKKKKIECPYLIIFGDLNKASITYNNITFKSNDLNDKFKCDYPSIIDQRENQFKFSHITNDVKTAYPAVIEFYSILFLLLNHPIFGKCILENPKSALLVKAGVPDFDNQHLPDAVSDIWLYKNPMEELLKMI